MGRTTRWEQKLGVHPDITIRHADWGWAIENVIIEWARWLIAAVCDTQPYLLIFNV
jgi:hypothetical protein